MLLRLDGRGSRYAQITRALCGLIQSGAMPPGARVPSTRELARDLGCSRNTVLLAYEQLTLEGYLAGRAGGGTFVCSELPSGGAGRPAPATKGARTSRIVLSPGGRRLVKVAARARALTRRSHHPAIDFMYGLCEPDAQIVRRMRTAFSAALRRRPFGYFHPAGDPLLRRELTDRLRGVRGITRSPDDVIVTSGAQQALEICARLLLTEGDRVIVEDPGYEAARAVFHAAGAEVLPVPVDRHGLDPDRLPESRPPIRLVYVTPSHQFPTGAVMPAARRYGLLAWARRQGALIVEDDYDGEFRYAGQRIAALAGLDGDASVIYCGTFAKSLFPAVRIGYLALPPALVEAAVSCKWLCDRGSPVLLQQVLAELMASGEYDRHIRRMQRVYRARRDALLGALKARLGSAAVVEGGGAGLHLVVWLPELTPAGLDALVAACEARDVGVYPVSRHAVRPFRRPGLMLGYGLLDVPRILRGIRLLADAYHEVR